MKTSSIKLCFHIMGAALCMPALLFIVLLLQFEEDAPTLSLLFVALGFTLPAIYMLAGAPHLTNLIKRKFPAEGRREPRVSHPRHGVKAIIGLGGGVFLLLATGCVRFIGLSLPEWMAQTLFVGGILSPMLMTWGAIHVAWFRGASPHGPLLVFLTGLVISLFLPAKSRFR